MKTFFRIQNILIIFAIISTVLTVAVFIGKVPADMMAAFNDHLRDVSGKPDPAAYVARDRQGGRLHRWHRSRCWTLLAMTWIYLNLSLHVLLRLHRQRGEGRPRLQLWSMPVTLLVVGMGVLITVSWFGNAVGYEFLGALADVDPDRAGLELHAAVHRTGLLRQPTTSGSPS